MTTNVTCPALYRVPDGDGGSDIDVCGTYATQDEDGTIRCQAGHVTRPTPAPASN
jgi:hypothetical protein